MSEMMERTVGLAIWSDTSASFSVAIEQFLEGWLHAKGLMLYRTEANGQLIFYSSSMACGSQTIDMIMTHAGKYAEDDDHPPMLIDLRRSTEYCVCKEQS